ncbi:MAG: ABC transporter permease [Geminicoccaceae bacterium]
MVQIARRCIHAIGLLVAVVVLNFFLLQLAPGDPAQTIAGEMGGITEEMLAKIRADYGLDQSLVSQLGTYLGRYLRFDFGYSFFFDSSVADLIFSRVPATLLLVLSALFLAVTVGTLFGVISAQKPNGWLSHLVTMVSIGGYSAPVFWIGLMLLVLFASIIPLFPTQGMMDISRDMSPFDRLLDVLRHLVLPTVTLAIIYLAQYSRLARASMLETLGADYIRTARAKGLSERTVIYKHALRNAVLPVITMAGLQFSQLFAGAVLVETVFNWPGMGRLAFDSILRRDYPTILGILFFSALIVIVANLLTDLTYRLIDPRIRTTNR